MPPKAELASSREARRRARERLQSSSCGQVLLSFVPLCRKAWRSKFTVVPLVFLISLTSYWLLSVAMLRLQALPLAAAAAAVGASRREDQRVAVRAAGDDLELAAPRSPDEMASLLPEAAKDVETGPPPPLQAQEESSASLRPEGEEQEEEDAKDVPPEQTFPQQKAHEPPPAQVKRPSVATTPPPPPPAPAAPPPATPPTAPPVHEAWFSPWLHAKAAGSMLQRYAQSKPLLWVHIHKAGGTYMCRMAQLAKERIVLPHENCNWKFHDGYHQSGFQKRFAVSCQERLEFFHRQSFTYGQIERELWSSDECWDEFSYGVMLRDPIALMKSEMNYRGTFYPEYGGGKKMLTDLQQKLRKPSSGAIEAGQGPAWKFMDNIQTRLLGDAMEVPPGKVSSQHVEIAKKRLSNFLAVARLEDLSDDRRQGDLFAKLGWPPTLRLPAWEYVNKMKVERWTFSENETEWLKALNRHDYELLEAFTT